MHSQRKKLDHSLPCLLCFTESVLNFFGLVAADGAWVVGVRKLRPEAWCLHAADSRILAEGLVYLSNSRALPISTLHALQVAFALTQANTL